MSEARLKALAQLLAKNFEQSFSRPWEALPEWVRQHWLEVAQDINEELAELPREPQAIEFPKEPVAIVYNEGGSRLRIYLGAKLLLKIDGIAWLLVNPPNLKETNDA